tara:strand:- start:4732 stop:4863 length:132 start_codon:yes stop_codon:yes gene_type:complete
MKKLQQMMTKETEEIMENNQKLKTFQIINIRKITKYFQNKDLA